MAGALTVNLNGNPDLVALQQKSDNDFDFKATTNDDVSINIGPYVSASGTYNLNNVDGTIDQTSTFGVILCKRRRNNLDCGRR